MSGAAALTNYTTGVVGTHGSSGKRRNNPRMSTGGKPRRLQGTLPSADEDNGADELESDNEDFEFLELGTAMPNGIAGKHLMV
ncbi:hypothetical protein OIO90_006627 [Microbotryomycetes sp. JL221]|nr:hypothetical protein OIO90_006627 [Microbotryomycetes sp. JL221]